MTFEDLSKLLDVWKPRLGLSDWRLILMLGGCEDETAYMELEHSIYYQRAVIRVNPWFIGIGNVPKDVLMRDSLTDDFIESSLVHELLHLYTRNLRDIVRSDLYGVLNRDLHEQIKNSMERVDEMMIDKLAEALTKAFKREYL